MSDIAQFITVDAIADAIRRGELHVEYQPIVDLTSGGMLGAEALVRWTHPLLGVIEPSSFIPSAESSGSIVEIGRFVLDTALAVAASWPRSAGVRSTYITVNVSGRELAEPDYSGHVIEMLARLGVDPGDLRLEIIESFVDTGSRVVTDNVAALSARGVLIVVDDFGTGYSDDRRVSSTGASVIKIDRSLTATITSSGDSGDSAGLLAILNDAAARSIAVIAEGIETPTQAAWFTDHGCTVGQGYLYAEAMSSDKLAKLLPGGARKNA